MKKYVPNSVNLFKDKIFLLIFFASLLLHSFQSSSQCIIDLARPNTNPTQWYYQNYDGRNTRFATNGLGNGTLANPVEWTSTPSIWRTCPVNTPVAHPNPVSNDNNVFIMINAGDFVTVENIDLKNNVTLVVCGYLTVRQNLVIGASEAWNNGRLIICPGGSLSMKTFRVHNNTEIVVDGSFLVDSIDGHNSIRNCIVGTGTIVTQSGAPPTIGGNITDFRFGTSVGQTCTSTTTVEGGVILPIELFSFTSKVKADRVDLHFTTGTEINNEYFTLERSRDLDSWEVLGHVPGAGNSSIPLSYTFSDLRPMEGVTYYRLKQTDFDGKFEYFRPIAVHYNLGMEGLEFKVVKQFSNWIIAVPNDGIYQVEVYNLVGHRLSSHKVENNLVIPAPEGAVVIRVTDGYSRTTSRVVM